jgi:hypothetical protein
MLKQSFSRMKKVLAILLAILFVVSLTFGAASACNSHGHHHISHSLSRFGSFNRHTCGSSHGHCCNENPPCHHGSCNYEDRCNDD